MPWQSVRGRSDPPSGQRSASVPASAGARVEPFRVISFDDRTWIALAAVFCALASPQLVRNWGGLALGVVFAGVAVAALRPALRARTFRPSCALFVGGMLFVAAPVLRPLAGTTTADWLFAGSFLLVVVESLSGRTPTLRVPPVWLLAGGGLVLLSSVLSAAASATPASALAAGVKFFAVTVGWIWLGALVLEGVDQVCLAVLAWLIGATAASIGAFVQLAFGDVIAGTSPSYNRMTGLTGQVNELGVITATALIPAVGLLVLTRGRDRCLLAAIGLLLICGLFLSGSLSSLAGLLVGIVVAVALAGRPLLRILARRRNLIAIGVAAVVLCAGVALAVADGLVRSPWKHLIASTSRAGGAAAKQQESFWFRVDTLKAAWRVIKAHPVFGVGHNPDALGLVRVSYVHDVLLGAWAGLGFAAMIGVVLCLVAPFAVAVGLLRRPLDFRPLLIALTGAAVVFTVYVLVSPALYRRYGWVPALLLIALPQSASLRPRARFAGAVPSDGQPSPGAAQPGGLGSKSAMHRSVLGGMSRTALLLVAVLVAAALVGTTYAVATRPDGSTVTATVALRYGQPSALLTQRQIDRYPTANPQHALLVWWRAAQFADYRGYLSGFMPQVRRRVAAEPDRMEAFSRLRGLALNATVKVLDVHRTSAGAALYTEIAYRAMARDGRVVAVTYEYMFRLARRGGAWRLGNDDFVQELMPHSRHRT